jgi:hypothetical protein
MEPLVLHCVAVGQDISKFAEIFNGYLKTWTLCVFLGEVYAIIMMFWTMFFVFGEHKW